MKSSLKLLALGLLLLLVPFATAHAQAPSLSAIPNVGVNAGATATVNVVAVDVGGRPIALTASLPSFGTLNTPTSGTGVVVTTLSLAPSTANVGTYTGAVTATAGGVANIKTFEITVNAAGSNRAPVVTAPALQEVTAGSTLSFTVSASDADADAITSLSASGVPAGATFTPNASNTSGMFHWTPGAGDVGEYDIAFTASNSLSGAAVTHIRVASAATVTITPIDDVTLAEGGSLSVPVSAAGVAGAMVTLTASLPSFATLNPPGSGTGGVNTTITVSPPAGSTGTHHASVTATSLGVSVTELFDIIVTGGGGVENHAPVLSAPASQTVAIGSTLSFDVTATDADGDHVDLFGSALPPGSGFLDHGDNTGTFTWSPVPGQAGTYTASFSGTDNRGGSGSASTMITVTGGVVENHAPTLSAPLTLHVDEGVNLSFTVTASDPDADHVALSTNSVPSGASFSDQGNDSGIFSWTPGSTQSGVYDVTFVGNDGHGGTGTATTTITVIDVGGGGGEVPGKACLIGDFKPGSETTCFRIRPVNGSFDVRNLVQSSITLEFHGESIAALPGGTQLEVDCHRHEGGGDGDDGGDNPGGHGSDNGRGHHDGAAVRLGGDHPHGDGHGDDADGDDDDACGISCDDHGHGDQDCGNGGDNHDGDHEGDDDVDCDNCSGNGGGGTCDTVAVRACFSTQALLSLFAGASLPCDLVNAEIHATLTNGATVVATFGGDRHADEDKDKDKNKDKDKDKNKDKNNDKNKDNDKGNEGRGGKDVRVLKAKIWPNPLNPRTELSFSMSREGRVRVTIYDMQGRLVKTLLDEVRAAGEQKLAWDGSNARSQRVASGVYFFRIQAPEGEVIQRVAVVK